MLAVGQTNEATPVIGLADITQTVLARRCHGFFDKITVIKSPCLQMVVEHEGNVQGVHLGHKLASRANRRAGDLDGPHLQPLHSLGFLAQLAVGIDLNLNIAAGLGLDDVFKNHSRWIAGVLIQILGMDQGNFTGPFLGHCRCSEKHDYTNNT